VLAQRPEGDRAFDDLADPAVRPLRHSVSVTASSRPHSRLRIEQYPEEPRRRVKRPRVPRFMPKAVSLRHIALEVSTVRADHPRKDSGSRIEWP
jgi:hypothetical protein